jgi:hypothetical protein
MCAARRRDHGSPVIYRSLFQSDPHISPIKTSTMITTANSLLRESGMPHQVDGVLLHTMSGTELSRVRAELWLLLREPINKSLIASEGPTLLRNQVDFRLRVYQE